MLLGIVQNVLPADENVMNVVLLFGESRKQCEHSTQKNEKNGMRERN